MEFKVKPLGKFTLSMFVVAAVGCSTSDETNNKSAESAVLYQAAENEVVIYYKREDATSKADYEGWGLHLWNGEGCTSSDLTSMGITGGGTDWNSPYLASGFNQAYGAYFVINRDLNAADPHECMNFILHKGNDKAFGSANQKVKLKDLGGTQSIFGFHGSSEIYYKPVQERPVVIDGQKAHWVDSKTIGWEAINSADKVELVYSLSNDIILNEKNKTISGGTTIQLTKSNGFSDELRQRFPHLASLNSASVNLGDAELKKALKGQLVMVAYDAKGKVSAATEVQKAGVLDAVFVDENNGNAIAEPLGAIVDSGNTQFKLWAPTAQNVSLYLYDADKQQTQEIQLVEDPKTGIWGSDNLKDVIGSFYRYEVTVYHPVTKQIETRMVTDPYSLSLSTNSLYSQIVDLDDESLKPKGWDEHQAPSLPADEYHVLYESHLRDLSFSDQAGSLALNGKYLALTEGERESVQHLQELQQAGLTTLHILPAFDIATVDEESRVDITDKVSALCDAKPDANICSTEDKNSTIESVLASYAPESTDAQALMNDLRMLDSFNWGYDPFHYTVPEGSYATNPEGTTRILEFREMVQATHDMGLKLIMDVVYNHTNASGVNQKSVLDKIVPGYYHRLNINTGGVENSTCCENTATENRMMGKLMVDSLVTWTQAYKVDGYRFDLMGHQPKPIMVEALAEVRKIDPQTLFYGEGWDFGEVANNARFEQSTQINMAGTEIGTFSDRLRDAVRGGSPFDTAEGIRYAQGFANNAVANELQKGSEAELNAALHNQDLIRVGMAGNLDNFVILDSKGKTKTGKDIDYNGAPAGYTKDPSENISYVSKHDNQTLWDNNAYKIATGVSAADRARMQTVALSTVMTGQGIPFIHMGSELLRSKSMQRDSYDSGDWYNRVKFNGSDNNWNVGLPRADKDAANFELIRQIIADETAAADAKNIELTKQQFIELLKIRSSSDLFNLPTAEAVNARIDFHNVGKDQVKGLIVMSIDDGVNVGEDIDKAHDAIVVVINASIQSQSFTIEGAKGFELHFVQQASADTIVKQSTFANEIFTVPALTTSVFVLPQGKAQGVGLPVNRDNKDVSSIPPYGETTVFVKGSMNGWADSRLYQMRFKGAGIYQVSTILEAGEHEFKFADSSWSKPNIGCDRVIHANNSLPLGSEDNCKVELQQAGEYIFTLDASYLHGGEAVAPVISLVKAPDLPTFADTVLYLRGDITDGNGDVLPTAQFDYVGNDIYQLTIELKAGQYLMKVADEYWSGSKNFGGNEALELGKPLQMKVGRRSGNIAITVPSNGVYTFSLNAKSMVSPVLTVNR